MDAASGIWQLNDGCLRTFSSQNLTFFIVGMDQQVLKSLGSLNLWYLLSHILNQLDKLYSKELTYHLITDIILGVFSFRGCLWVDLSVDSNRDNMTLLTRYELSPEIALVCATYQSVPYVASVMQWGLPSEDSPVDMAVLCPCPIRLFSKGRNFHFESVWWALYSYHVASRCQSENAVAILSSKSIVLLIHVGITALDE